MVSFLVRYILIAVACVFMLLGMQLPNLADQYAKRVDASLREVTLNFEPFQRIANQHTGGNIEALIKLHRDSAIAPFQAEGEAIDRMNKRRLRLQAQHKAMQGPLHERLWHLAMFADPNLREQTFLQYTPSAPLTQEALAAGAITALAALLLLEFAMALGRWTADLVVSQLKQLWGRKPAAGGSA
jgi:hypothetical protein